MVAGVPRRERVDVNPEEEEVQKRMEETGKEIPSQVLNREWTRMDANPMATRERKKAQRWDGDPPAEHVSKRGARIYGFISAGLGAGLAWLVFYRPRK